MFLRWLRRLFKNGEEKTSTLLSDNSNVPLILTVNTEGEDLEFSECAHGESSPGLLQSPFEAGLPRPVNTVQVDVCERTLNAIRAGSGIQELIDTCPEDVLTVLKELAVVKLGTFQATDSEVLNAFGKISMLTMGCESVNDPDWKDKWIERIRQKASAQKRTISVGWEELVTLGAYAVNIKHVATRDRGAILQLLSQKQSAGAASRKIWEFPAVRAVINYHWQHWAERFLMATSLLFFGWFLSFSGYCIVFIEADVNASGIGGAVSWIQLLSYVLNILCFIFMFPFAVMEYWTIVEQGRRWIQPRNIADVCVIMLQMFISVCHMINWSVDQEWFAYILAFQCVLLLVKLQIFGRVLNSGASFCGIFLSVLYDVRYLLSYILATGFTAALCLGAIYKHDTGYSEKKHHLHFKTFRNALVTTFEIVFGQFDISYIFEADYPWIKFIFFFGFQMLMTVTMLNLLIAMMTQSYSKLSMNHRSRYNSGRASMIDELEALRIPSIFCGEMHPYIHFLVVENKPRVAQVPRASCVVLDESFEELRQKVDSMTQQIKILIDLMNTNQ